LLIRLWDRLRGFERAKQRADRLYLGGDFDAAREAYRRALGTLGSGDHRAGALEALILSCERLSDLGPASRLRDASEAGEGRAEEDEVAPGLDDLFELAIAEKPASRAEAYRMLGESFRAGYVALLQGTAVRSVRHLERAAEQARSSFVVQLELGRALSLEGRLEEARERLLAAVRLSPSDAEGVVLLSAVEVELGRYPEAAEKLSELLDRGLREPEVTFLLGKALAGAGRRDAALEHFRETVELESRFHEAYFEAGRLMGEAGDVESAFRLHSRACALAPDEVAYNRELAQLVLRASLDEDAGLAACDRLMITDEERRWQYLHWIGELYIRRGWRREARDPLTKALELVPAEHKSERLEIEQRLQSLPA
jgi:tetratricopeptide (TPR) repeat protein